MHFAQKYSACSPYDPKIPCQRVIFWPKRILTLIAVTLVMDCERATAGLTRLTRLSLTSASQTAIVLNQALWNVLGRLCDLHLQNLEDQGNYEVHPIILTHSTCTTCLLDESCFSGIWGLTNSLFICISLDTLELNERNLPGSRRANALSSP